MLLVKKLETLEKRPNEIKVFFDDESSYILSLDTLAKFVLYEGKEVENAELEDILSHSFQKRLQEKAINYISYSPRTEFQVRKYLDKHCKKYNIEGYNIEGIIENLKEFKYIDDKEYAINFINSRLKNKPRGKRLLQIELYSKGIDKELALEVIEDLLCDDFSVMKKLYLKKYGDEKLKIEDKKKISFLQRKGFSWDDISKLIKYFENGDT